MKNIKEKGSIINPIWEILQKIESVGVKFEKNF